MSNGNGGVNTNVNSSDQQASQSGNITITGLTNSNSSANPYFASQKIMGLPVPLAYAAFGLVGFVVLKKLKVL